MSYAVVRLRAQKLRHDQKKTMESLRLHKINHATLVPQTDPYEGMIRKVEHFTTYGDIDQDTAQALLTQRGRVEGGDALTDDHVAEFTEYGDVADLAEALVDDEVDLGDLDGIKPVFRLAPAQGGFASTKRHFSEGGALGYRGEEINDLIDRML